MIKLLLTHFCMLKVEATYARRKALPKFLPEDVAATIKLGSRSSLTKSKVCL